MIIEGMVLTGGVKLIAFLLGFITVGVVLGTGVVPAAGGIADELTAVTRRAFIPQLVIQIYKSTPLLAALMSNAQMASGGISQLTVPVQGGAMTSFEWSGYGGNFNQPALLQGIRNAEFNLKLGIVPIPFLGMEGVLQMDHAVIPLIEARMNDATNVMRQAFANAMYLNAGADPQAMLGLPAAVDDGTNAATYGGINRTTNTWWKSVFSNPGSPVTPTRSLILQYINQVTKTQGEKPSMGVVGFGGWTKLAQDFTASERYVISPAGGFDTAEAAFTGLSVAGVPIYGDPFIPEGVLYLLNTNYLQLFMHEQASFSFTGFVSTLANFQLGYVGAVVTMLELINIKPITSGQFKNLDFINI